MTAFDEATAIMPEGDGCYAIRPDERFAIVSGDGSVGADRLDDIARRVRADLGVGRCLDQHHVLADGARHQLAHGLRKVVRIAGVQLRVLREAEVGVQIVDRARVQDTGDGCDAALERVLIGDAAGRQR